MRCKLCRELVLEDERLIHLMFSHTDDAIPFILEILTDNQGTDEAKQRAEQYYTI
jgi:hypothetical protein